MAEEIKILVIDDEEVVHASIRRILLRWGYQVCGVLSAQEGLSLLAGEKFDAVITDLMMPEMNGLEMLAAMKERRIEVPAIMVTGYPTIKTAIESLRLGAVDYIPKPFSRQELLGPLNRALRRGTDDPAAAPQGSAESSAPMPGDCFVLPEHSWALCNQDGTADIGIEAGFLASVPAVTEIETPQENDLVEQGHPGIRLRAGGEVHSVFMPLTGRVVEANEEASTRPEQLTVRTWLIRILPSRMLEEIKPLRKRN